LIDISLPWSPCSRGPTTLSDLLTAPLITVWHAFLRYCGFHAILYRLLHVHLLHLPRCRGLLLLFISGESLARRFPNELTGSLQAFLVFLIHGGFLVVFFISNVPVLLLVVVKTHGLAPSGCLIARLRWHSPLLGRGGLLASSGRGLIVPLTGFHRRREVYAVNLVNHPHGVHLILL
jgi:hypothetical protein